MPLPVLKPVLSVFLFAALVSEAYSRTPAVLGSAAALRREPKIAEIAANGSATIGDNTETKVSLVPGRAVQVLGLHHGSPVTAALARAGIGNNVNKITAMIGASVKASPSQVPAQALSTNSTPSAANSTVAANSTAEDGEEETPSYYSSLPFLLQVLAGLLTIETCAALTLEMSMRSWHRQVQTGPLVAVPLQAGMPFGRMFTGIPQLLAPYFGSDQGFTGRICCVGVLTLGLSGLFFSWVENKWQKQWWDLFNAHDAAGFPRLMGFYAVLVSAWMLNNVYRNYIQAWLYIDWRTFMTHRLAGRWLRGHTHYLIQISQGASRGEEVRGIDNPDQRLQEDVHLFVSTMTSIVPSFLTSVGTLLVFAPIVVSSEPALAFGLVRVPGWLLILVSFYSLCGAFSTQYIASSLSRLNYATQQYEAEFRHTALHVRDNSASVALYGSEATEENRLREHFQNIATVKWRSALLNKNLGFFTNAYGFAQVLIPFFILAPSYFRGDITLGSLFQLTSALRSVSESMDWFLSSYENLASLRATADRLLAFECAIDAVKGEAGKLEKGPGCPPSQEASTHDPDANPEEVVPYIATTGGTLIANVGQVRLPSGELLWRDVRLEVAGGQRLLISGPEGTGKSVLFKALAGIWPHVSDRDVRLPLTKGHEVVFVPQRPALPKRCSLGDALSYPEMRSSYSDADLLAVLHQISLEELGLEAPEESCLSPESSHSAAPVSAAVRVARLTREALDYVDNWGSRLSPGQQQRLAIGHILLKKPQVLFLDEATSNVSKTTAKELYAVLIATLPPDGIIVSISHDVPTLAALHHIHLEINGEGPDKTLKLASGKTV